MPADSRRAAIETAFKELWSTLFSSPAHLDSILFKQSPRLKGLLAQLVMPILLRPASMAEALGIGMAPGEPWSLSMEELSAWGPAWQMAERIHDLMQGGIAAPKPVAEDFPPGMLREWNENWGTEAANNLLARLSREAPMGVRVSRLFGRDQAMREIASGGKLPVKMEPSDLAPLGIRFGGYYSIMKTSLYEQGAIEIQDEGSQLMALFALWPDVFGDVLGLIPGNTPEWKCPASLPGDLKSGLIVIDACAGAGGKTLAMADAIKGKGRVYAYDTSEKKLQALKRRASRAGLRNIQTMVVGRESTEELASAVERFKGTADIVLVDAPCSGWGVLRRNPDIKWRQTAATLEKMPQLQCQLLEAYSQLVAPGGRLVFGVCTFRKTETVDVVQRFAERHPGFRVGRGGFLGPASSDGFFMQEFTKGT